MCQGLSPLLHLFPALSFLNTSVLTPVSGQQASTWLAHFLGCSETPPYQVLQLCRLPSFPPVSISFQPKSYSTTLASLDEVPKEFFFSNSIEHDFKKPK